MQPAAGTQGCVSRCDGEYAPGSAMHGSRSRQESSSHEMARGLECGPFIHLGVMPRATIEAGAPNGKAGPLMVPV